MTLEQILQSSFTKTKKAYLLFDLGYTRSQVAELITNGNYGFAHNIWKKWNDLIQLKQQTLQHYLLSFPSTDHLVLNWKLTEHQETD